MRKFYEPKQATSSQVAVPVSVKMFHSESTHSRSKFDILYLDLRTGVHKAMHDATLTKITIKYP